MRDFLVGVAVVRVARLAARAEERVGFVEEEGGVAAFGDVEHAREIAFGFVDEARLRGGEAGFETRGRFLRVRGGGEGEEGEEEAHGGSVAQHSPAPLRGGG